MGVLTQADGSAKLEQGNTKVLATVYGPHDVRKHSHLPYNNFCIYWIWIFAQISQKSKVIHNKCIINCQFSAATFSTNERKGRPKGDRYSAGLVISV